MMNSNHAGMSAATVLRVVALFGIALAIGPAFGVGLSTSLLVTALVALLAHERTVVSHWRQAPGRLAAPR